MLQSRSAFAPFLAVCLTLVACKLLKPSNEKTCAKLSELSEKAGKTVKPGAQPRCVTELNDLKAKNPEKHDCTTKCIQEADSHAAAGECLIGCDSTTASASKSTSSESNRPEPVDSLTPETVKSRIGSNYQYYGYDISNEKSNAAGWTAVVALGKKASYGEVHIYKVMLVDIDGKSDGYAVSSKLKSGSGATESRVGNKKLLFIECLYQRGLNESGTPKSCGSYDSKIRSFADDVEKG